MTGKTRIVLADDHPILLSGLRNLLCAEPDFDLVGEATTGQEALRVICEAKPDIAIVDISMPEMNGIVLSRRLADVTPSVRIVILTSHEERAYLKQALDAGARGYLLKRSAVENLIPSIRAVMTGGLYVDPSIASRLFDSTPKRVGDSKATAIAPELTQRETEVLKLVALGFTTKEIARQLDVGIKSIETYKSRGIEKLGLKTRAQLVRYASAQGWLANI